jgi:opacity protein-like surface antigen
MKLPRYFLAKTPFVVGCILVLIAASLYAQEKPVPERTGFAWRHQAGVRLGVWSNMGDLPPQSELDSSYQYSADIKDASFYFEGYFGFRISPRFMIEASLGIVNRGDVIIQDQYDNQYIGSLTLYPIQLRAKFYPLGATSSKVYPYLMGGLGAYHGRHDIQFTTDPYVISGNSKTSFSYALGGGFDYPVSDLVGIDFNVTYMPITFSEELFGVKDYQALTFTVGVKYLFQSPRK